MIVQRCEDPTMGNMFAGRVITVDFARHSNLQQSTQVTLVKPREQRTERFPLNDHPPNRAIQSATLYHHCVVLTGARNR